MYTLVNGDKRAHYLAMPRTGSKACRDAFTSAGCLRKASHHGIVPTWIQPGDLVMSTVRNHWDWFVSFWHLTQCRVRFDRFVPKLCRASEWIRRNPANTKCELYWKYAPLSSVILRYERLNQDLNEALVGHGFPAMELVQNGPKKPRPYQTYYKSQMREYVRTWFAEEIERYGYEF